MIDHEFGEVFAIAEDFFAVEVEVVTVGALPVEEVRVVVDTAAHVAE